MSTSLLHQLSQLINWQRTRSSGNWGDIVVMWDTFNGRYAENGSTQYPCFYLFLGQTHRHPRRQAYSCCLGEAKSLHSGCQSIRPPCPLPQEVGGTSDDTTATVKTAAACCFSALNTRSWLHVELIHALIYFTCGPEFFFSWPLGGAKHQCIY